MYKKQYSIENTTTKTTTQKSIPITKKQELIDTINLARPLDTEKKYTTNKMFVLHDPVGHIPLSSKAFQNFFLPCRVNLKTDFFQKYPKLDPCIRQMEVWHNYKEKPAKTKKTI